MDYPWAVPGAKVVYYGCTRGLIDGVSIKALDSSKTYTIRSIDTCPLTGYLAIRVVGVTNALCPGIGREHGYYAGDFRPVISRSQEQDVAIFKPLLNTQNIEERA